MARIFFRMEAGEKGPALKTLPASHFALSSPNFHEFAAPFSPCPQLYFCGLPVTIFDSGVKIYGGICVMDRYYDPLWDENRELRRGCTAGEALI